MFGLNTKVYVFLYGNFLPDEPNGEYTLRGLKEHITHVAPATSRGTMYLIKDAGGIETPTTTFDEKGSEIYGQLYFLNNPQAALDIMDMLDYSEHMPPEKCFHLRRQLRVTCADTGEKVRAWVYEFNPSSEVIRRGHAEVLDIIPSGDWLAFLRKRSEDAEKASA